MHHIVDVAEGGEMQEHCQKLERELEATSFFRMNQSHGALPAGRSIGLPPVAGRSGGEEFLGNNMRMERKCTLHGATPSPEPCGVRQTVMESLSRAWRRVTNPMGLWSIVRREPL